MPKNLMLTLPFAVMMFACAPPSVTSPTPRQEAPAAAPAATSAPAPTQPAPVPQPPHDPYPPQPGPVMPPPPDVPPTAPLPTLGVTLRLQGLGTVVYGDGVGGPVRVDQSLVGAIWQLEITGSVGPWTIDWAYGDGTSDTARTSPTASHSYPLAGTWTATATVHNAGRTMSTSAMLSLPQPCMRYQVPGCVP